MPEEHPGSLHPSLQFLLLVVILIGCMLVGSAIWAGLAAALYGADIITPTLTFNTTVPNVVSSIWLLQVLSTTIPILAAAYILGRYVVKQPISYLKTTIPNPLLLMVVIAVMYVSLPVLQVLILLNQHMVLPHFLKGVEQWMRDAEAAAQKQTALLLNLKTTWQMLRALLVVGLLTAIAEEFLFRGAVQAIFTRWTKNPHWGIWIAAILFSAIHMEFFGFLPRMVLGVFFGYFVLWSGSIWTSVLGHFVFNGTQVIITFLYQQKTIKINPDDQTVLNYGVYAFSLIITVLLFILYRKITLTKTPAQAL